MTDDVEAPAPIVHARAASEAIRLISHLTLTGDGGLSLPSDLHECVSALAEMAERLPQALAQLARLADAYATNPKLHHDGDQDPWMVLALAVDELTSAEVNTSVAVYLRRAANRLFHLGVRDA